MAEALLATDLTLPNKRIGKVRDLYDVTLASGDEALLIIATDRISAFDVVMQNGLPGKGVVLTQISKFWFDHFASEINHHLLSTDVADVPGLTDGQRQALSGRIMLCRKTEVVPIECIARGYITGSGWKDYQNSGAVCGIQLPAGLRNSDRLAQPLFTPSTKAVDGHDENISFDEAVNIVGKDIADQARDLSIELYKRGRDHAAEKGIIIADTKFEFGIFEGELILIDEVLTPDSSRFWPADLYSPGKSQPSFDKQFVRDYLETLDWDKTPPGPELPEDIVQKTSEKYIEAYTRVTGLEF